jgi:hypothetical protein
MVVLNSDSCDKKQIAGIIVLHNITKGHVRGHFEAYDNRISANIVHATMPWDYVPPDLNELRWAERASPLGRVPLFDRTYHSAWQIIDFVVDNSVNGIPMPFQEDG